MKIQLHDWPDSSLVLPLNSALLVKMMESGVGKWRMGW